MKIPKFLDRDNYLQNPIMRRFLKERGLRLVESRTEYIRAIEEYAEQSYENEQETRSWLIKIIKEGSKEFCYKKIQGIQERHRDKEIVKALIDAQYPDCPMENLLDYKNDGAQKLIQYDLIIDDQEKVSQINFVFSKWVLYGRTGELGEVTIFPTFVEVYLDHGFIVSRQKAKSTIFKYDENNKMLLSEYKINTMDDSIETIDEIIGLFDFSTENDKKKVLNQNSQMLYNLYMEYSNTPNHVVKQIESVKPVFNGFVDKIFHDLNLDIRNKEKALLDAKIFIEKFISINGDNEDIFKQDREAYLIEVSADDEIDLTKVDTKSKNKEPLQCTEAFFDGKKSVMNSKSCEKINLVFRRKDETYFKNIPLVVQFGTHKNAGYVKTFNYAEEVDIQNVLQAVFKNYK